MAIARSSQFGLEASGKIRTLSNSVKPLLPNLDGAGTGKNFVTFSSSGSMVTPSWATKMDYLIVRGGNAGSGATGGSAGEVLQGSTAITPGVTLTITVGGAGANSSVAISGGSTFTASTTGAAAQTNGPVPASPFNIGHIGGGGGNSNGAGTGCANQAFTVFAGTPGGFGGGGNGGSNSINAFCNFLTNSSPRAGAPNTGGGGGASSGTGGSGVVLLYFS
jgi:hypothetical protein